MQAFIKAVEIWAPQGDSLELENIKGSYGNLSKFKALNQSIKFEYDEGLPGKAWAQKNNL